MIKNKKHKGMLRTFLVLACLGLATSLTQADRSVTTSLNPDCGDKCKPDAKGSYINLQYVKLVGDTDIIHVMYSNIQSFTAVFFKTNVSTTLKKINWDNLLSNNATVMKNAIEFSDQPIESAGYEIASIFEFNDKEGTADMTKADATFEHRTDKLVWKKFVETDNVTGVFEGGYEGSNGTFRFTIRYPGKNLRDSDLPHLLLNPESSSIDFTIDSIEPKFNMSKFGINIIYLADFGLINTKNLRTIDDEYTPGTFKLWNSEITDDKNVVHNFLQWKPIFYYNATKTLEDSTITKQYDLVNHTVATTGIGRVFFDSSKKYSAMNVSYGLEGNEKDGYYYKQTNYSSWTFSIGLGAPPVEKMSFIVTLVIFVGFGLPALVIFIGLVVMIVKKLRNSRNSDFQPL